VTRLLLKRPLPVYRSVLVISLSCSQYFGLFETLFDISSAKETRESDTDWSSLSSIIDDQDSQQVVRSEEFQLELILEGVALESGSSIEVRSTPQSEVLAQVIREELPKTQILQFIQQSELLVEIGRMLGASLQESTDSATNLYATRSNEEIDLFSSTRETRSSGTKDAHKIRAILQSLDRLTGKMLDRTLGQLNQNLRRLGGVQFVSFFGDVFTYQGGKEKFHQRLRDCIERHTPGWGNEERPINILAHSLGGVLSFDAAVVGQPPLWIDNFVTFGSQSSFFHIVDPRKNLSIYVDQQPVELPKQIGNWFNLWEPLDFLAFNAARVFRLSGGRTPKDIPIFSPVSRILGNFGNTHGVYWESNELVDLLRSLPTPLM
jgi:hypothetical protein